MSYSRQDLTDLMRRKPHLFRHESTRKLVEQSRASLGALPAEEMAIPGVRLKQDKPVKLNKGESQWMDRVAQNEAYYWIRAQSLRLRLANGAWYKPDISATRKRDGALICWEVKGPERMKGVPKGKLALKVAASTFPEIKFYLVWKDERNQWREQEVKP